ncbi:hypothetical protein FQA39_LY18804 [Lamprigera yunnana]|nr:hypothetical protein FQA39_LY18804 [Lamprigera yunnana]
MCDSDEETLFSSESSDVYQPAEREEIASNENDANSSCILVLKSTKLRIKVNEGKRYKTVNGKDKLPQGTGRDCLCKYKRFRKLKYHEEIIINSVKNVSGEERRMDKVSVGLSRPYILFALVIEKNEFARKYSSHYTGFVANALGICVSHLPK